MQIRKVADLPKGGQIELPSGKKVKMDRKSAIALNKKFDSIRKPQDKLKLQKMMNDKKISVVALKRLLKNNMSLRKAIEKVILKEEKKETLEEQKITMPKLRKVKNINIGLTFKHPNTLYSIRFRKEEFFIAPSEIKDLIKILSQRDIVTKNPAWKVTTRRRRII